MRDMASETVRSVISAVLEDDKLMQSKRNDAMKVFGETLLARIMKSDGELELFEKFSIEYTSAIDKIFSSLSKRIRSPTTKRTRAWEAFHQEREKTLPRLWHSIFVSMKMEEDSLFTQSVNQELFQQKLHEYLSKPGKSAIAAEVQLTFDELNAMRYACGYIPHKLLKRYGKQKGSRARHFVKCLKGMAMDPDEVVEDEAVASEESDILLFTKSWINRVDRGGLFPLNDQTFCLFADIEKLVRGLLPKHMLSTSSDNISKVIEKILSNDDVQLQWAVVSLDINSDEESQELLQEVITKWVTVRGFSIASTWIEIYKQACKETTSKSTGLRKHLS